MTDDDLSHDAFLNGRLHLWQPRKGYRAGVDPVLLAASVPAEPGQNVLDMGCGAGAAALCLGCRVSSLRLTGLEIQQDYAELARRNGQAAGLDFDVLTGDIFNAPAALKQQAFDHVITNPPYFDRSTGTPSGDAARERAIGWADDLDSWLTACFKRLRPGGWFHMIYRPEYLHRVLSAPAAGMGSWEIHPLAPRVGRPASLVILRARKDGRAPLKLAPPVLMHRGTRHEVDGDDYTDQICAVLRDGAALIL